MKYKCAGVCALADPGFSTRETYISRGCFPVSPCVKHTSLYMIYTKLNSKGYTEKYIK